MQFYIEIIVIIKSGVINMYNFLIKIINVSLIFTFRVLLCPLTSELSKITMEYWPPPWYIEFPTYDISNPLPMVF